MRATTSAPSVVTCWVENDAAVNSAIPPTSTFLRPIRSDKGPATSAAAALRAIAAGPQFDVILCDLMMPGGSGQDLHRRLSVEHPAQARAMVFMTGGVLSAETQAFLDEIPNPVLFKPFEVERLEAVLLSSRT